MNRDPLPLNPPADTLSPLMALLTLGRRARAVATPEELGFVMVNETLQLLDYRQAALWSELGWARVAAVSGLPEPDPTAPYVQWLAGLFKHLRASKLAAGAIDAETLPAALKDEWPQWLPAHALWWPLQREGEGGAAAGAAGAAPGAETQVGSGALLLARDRPWAESELALMAELAHAYGHAWAAFQPHRPWHQRVMAGLRTGRLRRGLMLAGLALCLLPVRLTVLAPAEVSPVDPFIVRAPLEGVVDRFEVKPNQAVQAGDALFNLDATTLRARLEVARKAYDTAQEEYRQTAQLAVTSDKNRAEIALRRGKLQEKAVQLAYDDAQFERVQVKAERAGMAVFADANDWIGKAVAQGERILLVADPAKVELTAWLPAADQIEVKPGDTLRLYPKGSPLDAFEATVHSVAYRAELTPEGVLAYRVKASFEAVPALPRIGQMGTARLQGPWVPMVYAALRRPLGAARQWLGW